MGHGDNVTDGNRFAIWTDNNAGCSGQYTIGVEARNTGRGFIWVPDTNWHHIVATYPAGQTDINQTSIYLDGIALSSPCNNPSSTFSTTNTAFAIGRIPNTNAAYFPGEIDEVRVYDRALSAGDITELYNDGNPGGSLVGWWKLDEGSGTITEDASGNGHHGTLVSSPAWTAGIRGTALSFDTSNYIAAERVTAVTDNWTISAWVNPASLPQNTAMIFYNGSDQGGYGIVLGPAANSSEFGGLYGQVVWIGSGYSLPSANTWYHLVMVRDSGTAKFYVNGVQTANTSNSNPLAVAGCLSIAEQYDNCSSPKGRRFNGKIDDVRIYDRALTAADVQGLYDAGSQNIVRNGQLGGGRINQ